jgi:hypothetical protein
MHRNENHASYRIITDSEKTPFFPVNGVHFMKDEKREDHTRRTRHHLFHSNKEFRPSYQPDAMCFLSFSHVRSSILVILNELDHETDETGYDIQTEKTYADEKNILMENNSRGDDDKSENHQLYTMDITEYIRLRF